MFGRALARSRVAPCRLASPKRLGSTYCDVWELPRFTGIPSFMRTPIVDPIREPDRLHDVDIAMFGVPFDGGVTNRPGARHGPRAVRNASSLMRLVHHHTRVAPFQNNSVADVGDVPIFNVYNCANAHKEIEQFADLLAKHSVVPLAVGGDHSITFPLLKAMSRAAGQPLALIHMDAHTDTWDSRWGEDHHHGAPMRRAVEAGAIDPRATIQIGIRGAQPSAEGWDYSTNAGMRVVFMEEAEELGPEGVVKEILRVVGDRPCYLSFDIDCLDPVFAPGTGTPECGGFTSREAFRILRGLRGVRLVGGDMVEVSPPFDVGDGGVGGVTATVGATVLWEMLCLLGER